MVQAGLDGIVAPLAIAEALRPNTKLVVVTHASNVNGAINDIATIGKLVRAHGALFLVDAAQTAGCLPIAVDAMAIDLIAFPGHKGLLGPQGTGGLYIRPGLLLAPLRDGGTGSLSHLSSMPEIAPDRYESGTPNTPGLAGLGAGVEQVRTEGIAAIRARERQLVDQLWDGLAALPGVTLHGPADSEQRTGIVALTVAGRDCEELAAILDQDFSIACRAGLSCAPLAHATLGTQTTGVVRLSVGFTTTAKDVDEALTAFHALLR